MTNQSEDRLLEVLLEIRVAAQNPVKMLLQEKLPDAKSRAAYQMLDGKTSIREVRIASKMSPNALQALADSCVAAGLMEVNAEKKRVRLFNLADFGLLEADQGNAGGKE
jgi:hypothetical protein